jgi:hypothetical protein
MSCQMQPLHDMQAWITNRNEASSVAVTMTMMKTLPKNQCHTQPAYTISCRKMPSLVLWVGHFVELKARQNKAKLGDLGWVERLACAMPGIVQVRHTEPSGTRL